MVDDVLDPHRSALFSSDGFMTENMRKAAA